MNTEWKLASARRPVSAALPTAIVAALVTLALGMVPAAAQTPPEVDAIAAEQAAKGTATAKAAEEAAAEGGERPTNRQRLGSGRIQIRILHKFCQPRHSDS